MTGALIFTIFGGTGDLTFRKLLPALYGMAQTGKLGEEYQILAVGRRDYSDDQYRELARESVKQNSRHPYDDEDFAAFSRRVSYVHMDFTDSQGYSVLNERYTALGAGERIYYFAVAPRFFPVIAEGLSHVADIREGKIVLEKPFGEDLESARELNLKLESVFPPERIFRIDHYLGKEMVRGILAIRFTNPIFNYVWDARHIEFIQISALEEAGIENRSGYYETSGALKDMVQNHLFQILSIVAMERPAKLSGPDMHTEQLRVLRSLASSGAGDEAENATRDSLALGQYEGYRDEKGVAPDSSTETFAALRVFIDNDRWRNMPFYIRTGKKTGRQEMDVVVVFRREGPDVPSDVLIIKIQPTEGVYLQFNMKKPGDTEEIVQAKMDFCRSCIIQNRTNTPEAYERLLEACVQGEQSWFSQWDQIEAGWSYIEDIKKKAAREGVQVYPYAAGVTGPDEATRLPGKLGHEWFEE